jgi:HK97 family phage portal protein
MPGHVVEGEPMSLFFRKAEQRSGEWFNTFPDNDYRTVSTEKSTYLGPVFSALRHIVDYVSTLPLDAYRMDGDTRTELNTLPLLLRSQNDIGRAGVGQWFGQAAYGLATAGNAVGWIAETDGFGFPSVVNWLRREWWTFDEINKQWYVGGQPVGSSQLVHIPWIVPTGHTLGLSPIEHYAALTRAGLSAQDYADVRRGGGLPPSVLKNSAMTIQSDAAAVISDRAAAAFKSGKPFVTGSDWDLNVTVIPPSHAQFIETLKLTATQIASIYGIDPREIGGDAAGSLTYSTDESRPLNRANDMRPYIVRLENAFNRLLPERQFVKLNVDATFRTDLKTRTDVIGAQLADGRLSLNEARALEDRPPVTNGDFHNGPAPTAAPITRGELP